MLKVTLVIYLVVNGAMVKNTVKVPDMATCERMQTQLQQDKSTYHVDCVVAKPKKEVMEKPPALKQ